MNEIRLVDVFNEAWGWTGRHFAAITAISPFGHLILKDDVGGYSYCDPELFTLTDIADRDESLFTYMSDTQVRKAWESMALVARARAALGESGPDRVYHWKTAPMFGGSYESDNMATLNLAELVRYSGDLAEQIGRLPERTPIELKVLE